MQAHVKVLAEKLTGSLWEDLRQRGQDRARRSRRTRCDRQECWSYSFEQGIMVCAKGEVYPKMITSYLVVFGALSRMVKVRGACVFGYNYKRLNSCIAPTSDSDDTLVVDSLACAAHKNTSSSTTKTSLLSGARRVVVIYSG